MTSLLQEDRAARLAEGLGISHEQALSWVLDHPEQQKNQGIGKSGPKDKISMQAILSAVCAEFDIPHDVIRSVCRLARVVHPRQAFYWLARNTGKWSYPQMGRFMRQDHTTVLHAVESATWRILSNPAYGEKLMRLQQQLGIPHHPQVARKACPHCGGALK